MKMWLAAVTGALAFLLLGYQSCGMRQEVRELTREMKRLELVTGYGANMATQAACAAFFLVGVGLTDESPIDLFEASTGASAEVCEGGSHER